MGSVLGSGDLLQARQAFMRDGGGRCAAQWQGVVELFRRIASREASSYSSSNSGAGGDVTRAVGDSGEPGAFGGGSGLASVGLFEGGLLVSQDGRDE